MPLMKATSVASFLHLALARPVGSGSPFDDPTCIQRVCEHFRMTSLVMLFDEQAIHVTTHLRRQASGNGKVDAP
jgi:hypothetical protein